MAHKRNRFFAVFFVGHLGLERKGDGSVCEQNRPLRDVDGRGVAFVTNYDYLGRVTTESATQSGWTETITRNYGTSVTGGTGQMRLISESLGNWTKSYEYDTYGNVTNETMTNGTDITRSKTYQYDSSNGLLSQKTLPGGVTNSYTYDVYGNLTGVNGASGAIKWSLADYTGRSTETRTILDNRTSSPFTRITHLDQYGYPEYIKTHQNGYYYQIDDYGFSSQTGNLMALKHKGMNQYMLFHYDDNDRLSWVEENSQNIMSMSYTPNGNITEKSDIGSYTYDNTSKPHAVQSVQNSRDKINYNEQSISYNPWNKVDNIWQTDDTDFYYYFAQYGPDLEKVYSTMDKTYHDCYEKFTWGDYEEKTVDGVTTRYYYVSGADGLVGLHTEKDAPSGTVTNNYVLITDHLGSITMMVDNYDDYNEIRYDPWGNRYVVESFLDEVIDRGYTGHEHLDQLGLIDMKGRMYDAKLGRFLSPDPFVQAPTNPQNYNRYSYCLNNPLKYTDPSGDLFIFTLFTCVWDFFDTALFKGGLDITSPGAMKDAWKDFDPSASWSKTNKSFQMSVNVYRADPNLGFWDQANEILKRLVNPLTYVGDIVNQTHNLCGGVKSVDFYGGATLVESYASDFGAFTIGNFINAQRGTEAIPTDELFQHEFGHYLFNRTIDPVSGIVCSLISLGSAKFNKDGHKECFAEIDANRLAFEYFFENVDGFGYINEKGERISNEYIGKDGKVYRNWHWQHNPLNAYQDSPGIYKERYIKDSSKPYRYFLLNDLNRLHNNR